MRILFSMMMAVFLLSACTTTPVTPDDIVMSEEITDVDNWARYLPDLYNPMMTCVKAHTSQPAYVMEAGPMNHGRAFARIQGRNDIVYDCVIEMVDNAKPEHFKIVRDAVAKGPSFYPTRWGKPRGLNTCERADVVKTTKGRTLGWLVSKTCDATDTTPRTLPFRIK